MKSRIEGRSLSLFPTFIREPSAFRPFERPDCRPPSPFIAGCHVTQALVALLLAVITSPTSRSRASPRLAFSAAPLERPGCRVCWLLRISPPA